MNNSRGERPVLPRPVVTVTTNQSGGTDVVISRGGTAKSYQSDQPTRNEAVKELVEKIIGDRHTGEWLPGG
jgi:hypothetical protein